MNVLYVTCLPGEGPYVTRYIGYVLINGGAVKVMEAQCMEDVRNYVKERRYSHYEYRVPKYHKYQMIRVKEW